MSNPFHIASQHALSALNEELRLTPQETHLSLYRLLMELRLNYRLYYLSAGMVTTQLWPLLRDDNDLMELLLRGGISFSMALEGDGLYIEVCTLLGKAYGELSGKEVTDESFYGKLTPANKLTPLFRQERWLTFLVLLERNTSQIVPDTLLTAPLKKEGRHETRTD